jgi:hypothetical protein
MSGDIMNKTAVFALSIVLPVAALGLLAPMRAQADPRHDHDHGHAYYRGPGWGHGDIRHFSHYDARVWHGGHWVHGNYGNRFGWWWVVAGAWYLYPGPVYPYPDPYVPPVVVTQQYQVGPAPAAPTGPAPVQYWYYCRAAKAYYPYVAECPAGWEKVPATPAPAATNAPPG